MKTERTDINSIELLSKYRNSLMGFASLWIIMFHLWTPVLNPDSFAGKAEIFIRNIGFCGVDIFFLLSGMGLVYSMRKSTVLSFYLKRLKRIFLPAFTIAVIFAIRGQWDAATFWGNISGYRFYAVNMYSFLWFIPAIITLYIVFPWYYKLLEKAKDGPFFLYGTLALWMILMLLFQDVIRPDLFGFLNRIPIFCIGVLFGWKLTHGPVRAISRTGWGFLILLLILGDILSYCARTKGMFLLVPTSDCFLPNICISVSISLLLARLLNLLENRESGRKISRGIIAVLSFYGAASLELYCIQERLGANMTVWLTQAGHKTLLINLEILAAVTLAGFLARVVFETVIKLCERGVSILRMKESAE